MVDRWSLHHWWILGETMRTELYQARTAVLLDLKTYNAIFTLHGLIMIFLIVIPGLTGGFRQLYNAIMIGATMLLFHRLNPVCLVSLYP